MPLGRDDQVETAFSPGTTIDLDGAPHIVEAALRPGQGGPATVLIMAREGHTRGPGDVRRRAIHVRQLHQWSAEGRARVFVGSVAAPTAWPRPTPFGQAPRGARSRSSARVPTGPHPQ